MSFVGAGIAGVLAGAGGADAEKRAKTAGVPVSSSAAQVPDMIPAGYDPAYVEHVIMPFLRTSFYQAETPSLPMIGEAFSKQYAIPFDLWGLLYDDWAPSFEKDGLSVFILGLDKRGQDNRRKRIYISALTADLYPIFAGKVRAFFDQLLDEKNAGKPLMQRYLDSYFDLFWDLHLGVKGDRDSRWRPPDRAELQHGYRFPRSAAASRLRQLHEGARAQDSAEEVDRREDQRHHEREDKRSREDLCLLLDEEWR